MGGAWPVGLPMEREKEEVSLSNEQAVRAAALQAAAVTVASINGSEEDVILLAEDYAAYIRGGPRNFQKDPSAEQAAFQSNAWSESSPGSGAQEFATRGYNARTKEEFGEVWKAAREENLMRELVVLGDGEQQELGAYLTVLAAKFKTPTPEQEKARQSIRNDMGL